MEGGSFFGGLLRGFGGGLQQAEAARAREDLQTRQTMSNILLTALENDPTEETASAVIPALAQIMGTSAEKLGLTGKGARGPLSEFFAPDNQRGFGALAMAGHRALVGAAPGRPLEGFGPAPMGRTNPPEMRPQDVTPAPDVLPQMEPQDVPPAPPAGGGRTWPPLAAVPPTPAPAPDASAPLPTRSTMVAPPARPRGLFAPRGEREAQATQRKVAEQTATTAAGYQGRINVAEKLIRDETDTFRRTHHREPTAEDAEAIRTNAYSMVGMDVTAKRATPAAAEINARALYESDLAEFRTANEGRDPSPSQKAIMLRKALREEADATRQASSATPAYQQKEVLLDDKPALVNYDSHTGKYSVGDQDVSARVQPMPPTVDPTLQALRQMQLDTARRGTAGRAVTAADARRIGEFNSGRDDLAVLNDAIATTGATGTRAAIGAAVPNWVTNVTGWGTDAKQKQALIDRVKQVIGKTLEGGVLRKEDEIKYTRILPTIGDPNAVVLSKLQGLDAAIEQRRQDHLDALSDAGYDVSRFQARATRPPIGERTTDAAVPAPVAAVLKTQGPGRHTLSDGSVWEKHPDGSIVKVR